MPTVRLHQIIKETNFGLDTIVDFLRRYGFDIEINPNSSVPEEARELCLREFPQKKDTRKYTERGYNTLIDLSSALGYILHAMAYPDDNDVQTWVDKWNEINKTIVDDDFADYSRYVIDSFSYYSSKYRDIFGDSVPVLERLNYFARLRVLGLLFMDIDTIPFEDYSFAEAVSRRNELKEQWNDCSKHKFNTQFDRRLFDSYEKVCKIFSECLVFQYLK